MTKHYTNGIRWDGLPPAAFKSFDWEFFFVLYAIPIVLLLFILKWLIGSKIKQKLPVALPKKEIRKHWASYLRIIPNALMALSLMLLLVALARPQRTNEEVEQWSEGIDIALVIDISESMQIEDFKPNRLEAAKRTARNFIGGRSQDRIGLVIFSGDAYSLSPLTTDYELLYKFIEEEIDFNKIENRGTAIGSAIAVGTNRMRESTAASKVMILMSDGDNTAGNIDPRNGCRISFSVRHKNLHDWYWQRRQSTFLAKTSSVDQTMLRIHWMKLH